MGQKLLFFAPIFFAATYAQINQPTNQTNQPTNRNCLGKSHQPSIDDTSIDFWIEEKGNKYVLQALNAAMYKINTNINWRRIVTELGGTFVTSAKVDWPPSSGAMGTFQYMMKTRKIRFGSTLTFFPFSINDTGCINGTEIDLANMIAREFTQHYGDNTSTPFEAAWVRIDRTSDFWYDIAFALSGDQDQTNDYPAIDVILSTVTKTAKREEGGMARFTSSYLSQKYGIVLSDQGLKKGLNLSTLDNAAYKIAVGIGTTNEEFVNKTYPNIQMESYESISQRMDAVKKNQTDAAIGDATYIKSWAIMNNKRYLGSVGDAHTLAMAVRPAKQPSTKPIVKECTMLANPTSSALSKYCFEKSSISCEKCFFSDRCHQLIQEKREGTCCMSSKCCKARSKGKCILSVTRKASVKCKTSYLVIFEARGTNDFTEKTVYGTYLKQCGESKQCLDDLLKDSRFKKDQNVECTVSSNGNIVFPEVESLNYYSSASYRFISFYSILFLFVWVFFPLKCI